MINLPVATAVADGGKIETLHIWLEDESGASKVELRRITDDGGVLEQIQNARSAASAFLTRSYVTPLVYHTLERGTLVIEAEIPSTYRGGSFGLAFLSAFLALGLGVKLRPGRLFTAKLGRLLHESGAPGGTVELESASQLQEKLAAACIADQGILFVYTESERQLMAFEEYYWRGEANWNCLPKVLPKKVSTASFVAMSLDTAPVLQKCLAASGAEAFALLMLAASADTPDGMSFAAGIGDTLARLRNRARLSNIKPLKELAQDMGLRAISNGEQFIMLVLDRALEACPDEQMSAELIKAAIAADSDVACWPLTPELGDAREGVAATETSIDAWLNRVDILDPNQLFYTLSVIGTVSRIAPDYEGYWSQSKRVILNGLSNIYDIAAQLVQQGKDRDAAGLSSYLLQCNLGEKLARIRPDWISEAVGLIERFANTLKSTGHTQAYKAACELRQHLSLYDVPEVIQPLQATGSNSLVLTFRLADRGQGKDLADYPRPPLSEINDLELEITGPQKLSLRIPSPVLLLENFAREPCFCWRQGAVGGDDTLSRYPLADSRMVRECFAHPKILNRIGFQIRRGPRASPAAVQWHSTATPWPPAIDTQLLVAAMVKWGQNSQPKKLLDVGCGTGFLAIAACHLWPSLKEVNLTDIDPASVWAAEINLRNDPLASSKRLCFYKKAFKYLEADVYDVLVCNPPYLPSRPLPPSRIEQATNNTYLLEQMIHRGNSLAKELWLVFSSLAWHEFRMALAKVGNSYRQVEILSRDFVPFRISWLAPLTPQEQRGGDPNYVAKERYFSHTLMPRGLIDLNTCPQPWPEYLQMNAPILPESLDTKLADHTNQEALERRLDLIQADSRGFRFWHEVRVVRLTTRTR